MPVLLHPSLIDTSNRVLVPLMTERYDTAAAAHYAAYRPALHGLILDRALGPTIRFGVGVDVGCGTGRSTVALAARCTRTIGVDPSVSMLRRAMPQEGVSYLRGTANTLPVPEDTADVITFAGSLYYADSAATRREVLRVGRVGAVVLVYDFEVLLASALSTMQIEMTVPATRYDHTANFSGRDGFAAQAGGSESIELEMSASDFAHLVLSDSHRLDYLSSQYGRSSVYEFLVRRAGDGAVRLTAVLHFSSYVLAHT